MAIASLVLGLLSMTGVCVGFIPFLNILNLISLPMALFGAIFGLTSILRARPQGGANGLAIAGLSISGLALLVGGTRFVISLLTTGGVL